MKNNTIHHPKARLLLSSALILTISSTAQAHDLWSYAQEAKVGKPLKAVLGYGDNFPLGDSIAPKRLPILNPLQLVTQDGTQTLTQQGENFQYVSSDNLTAREYKITATYKPTFWSKNQDGWQMQNLTEMTDAHYCEQSSMYATTYFIPSKFFGFGLPKASSFATQPAGLALEIVPMTDPTAIKTLKPMPVQVLLNGKPLAGANVIGTSDKLTKLDWQAVTDHREPQAFSGKTDSNGVVNVIPLIKGNWKLKVSHESDFDDPAICQKQKLYSTYTFMVK